MKLRIMAAVAVTMVASGTAFGGGTNPDFVTTINTAPSSADPGDDTPGWEDLYDRWENEDETADGYRVGAIVGYAVGGGLLLTGGVLMVLDWATHRKETPVALRPAPGGLGVTF